MFLGNNADHDRFDWLREKGGRFASASVAEEITDAFDNIPGLLICKLRIDGQRQSFVRCAFALWKRACLMSERREAFLQIQWHRIIDFGAHALFLKRGS